MITHKATCPACGAPITYPKNIEHDDILTCLECGGDWQVSTDRGGKIQLLSVPQEEEDE